MSTELIWNDSPTQELCKAAGLTSFDDFWDIENKADELELQIRRQHLGRNPGEILRQTIKVPLGGKNYFLKRTSAESYWCIKAEYEGGEFVKQFGLVPPTISVCSFDEENKQGFILFADMDGFYCLDDYNSGSLTDEAKAQLGNIKDYYPTIIDAFKKFQKSDYFYRDWMDKHIFINPTTKEIGLIDLERFRHKKDYPLFWRLPFVYQRKRGKELKKLLGALKISSLKDYSK